MAQVLTKEYIEQNPEVIERLKKSVFIYPTDTIYGIGCDATNEELVARVREIKKREHVPFSVIVPNKKLIKNNCQLSDEANTWLDKLPGPYTLILPLAKSFVAPNVSPDGKTIGVRMLSNWFQEIVEQLGIPIVTTSVNLHGKPFMTSFKTMDADIKKQVDIIIDDGELHHRPSQLINLLNEPEAEPEEHY
ncbi:threonylcarbamoyl-AMP synthase [Candidatus Woesearchaeota archaeon]|nr:threonylcarbamoyl-AMP synthase [Candidatus Woesearchaeota archaeon]